MPLRITPRSCRWSRIGDCSPGGIRGSGGGMPAIDRSTETRAPAQSRRLRASRSISAWPIHRRAPCAPGVGFARGAGGGLPCGRPNGARRFDTSNRITYGPVQEKCHWPKVTASRLSLPHKTAGRKGHWPQRFWLPRVYCPKVKAPGWTGRRMPVPRGI
jgi:hypothetical protein